MKSVGKRMQIPIVSLCIPTNGMTEWVIPVLDSIYKTEIDENRFEVVIEDNGNKKEFEEAIRNYQTNHFNLSYYKSSSQGFLCQIDCFKHAKGNFIKFINHRSRLTEGALDYFISFAENNLIDKPVAFFSNGNISDCESNTFDEFVRNLGFFSSWSGGLSFWKEDMYLIENQKKFNTTFPHVDILFARRNSRRYLIISRKVFDDIEVGHALKGRYNLFRAFAVEYPSIINDLLRENEISAATFLDVKDKLLTFISDLYIQFIIYKEPASYSFDEYEKYIQIFYSNTQFKKRLYKRIIIKSIKRFIRIIWKR